MDDTHTRAHDDTQVLLESGEGGGDVEVSAQLRDCARSRLALAFFPDATAHTLQCGMISGLLYTLRARIDRELRRACTCVTRDLELVMLAQ